MMKTKLGIGLSAVVLVSGLGPLAHGQTLANPESLPRVAPAAASPATYGTSQTSYLTIFESQLSPFTSAVTYDDLGNGVAKASRYATGGSGAFLAPANLPNGALVTSLEVDACDSNGGGNHVEGILGQCDIFGNNCAAIGTPLLSVSNPTTPCQQLFEDVSALNYTVNNLTGRVFVEFLTQSLDNTNAVSGALIGYKLQVSPPPASADFADVPKSSPQFQFVEALFHAGITAGCGGGNYCPDNPVTRGQMAVFLAKALGLQFP
jgi:hypothetical protein